MGKGLDKTDEEKQLTTEKTDTNKIATAKADTKKITTAKADTKKITTAKADTKKITTAKADTKKIETAKTDTKKIGTTKAEPVTKRITTKKNSGNANVYVQYAGKEVDVSAVVKKIEDKAGAVKNLDIYIKPEDGKVYYVCDNETGAIDML